MTLRTKSLWSGKSVALIPDADKKEKKDKIVKLEEILHAQGRMLRELNIRLRFLEHGPKITTGQKDNKE